MTSVVFPTSITSIGWYAFYGCSRLSSVTFLGAKPTFDSGGVFVAIAASARGYYPSGSASWSDPTVTGLIMSVTAANNAPVAAAGTVTSIVRDVADGSNPGTLVSALVTNFTDADSGAVKGIAVTAVVTTNGTWYYSTNAGSTWLTLTGVSIQASAS